MRWPEEDFFVWCDGKEYGVAPINYAIDRRISQAVRSLHSSDDSVSEISRQVGYDNPAHFVTFGCKMPLFWHTLLHGDDKLNDIVYTYLEQMIVQAEYHFLNKSFFSTFCTASLMHSYMIRNRSFRRFSRIEE